MTSALAVVVVKLEKRTPPLEAVMAKSPAIETSPVELNVIFWVPL
jgi:hypothetical protein